MSTNLILGTAGHIDHGKTTLIKCLTGIDTDRLPEEKRRGITIELGFAELDVGDFRLGIVDVPGHERFVRQMLAGATGIDVALLVVAADDSVKPQTREHLDVLRLLDIQTGVIALTKVDLADPDWIMLVEDEVQELVRGSFLAGAPIIRTSATTGDGIENLKQALENAAIQAAPRAVARRALPFRMAIDRCFTLSGHGTVVTGSVASGTLSVGDRLNVEPGGTVVRVRNLHNHDREVQQVSCGQRAAINLAGVHHDQIERGHELAAPGHLLASRLITCRVAMLDSSPRPLKPRSRVRFHAGTAEVLASLVPLDQENLRPGDEGLAQLFLREPIVTTWNQPFVLRTESPLQTIAGGHVLVPSANKLRHPDEAVIGLLGDLASPEPRQRAAAAIYFSSGEVTDPQSLARTAGVEDGTAAMEELVSRREVLRLSVGGQRQIYLHARQVTEYAARVVRVLTQWHDKNPLRSLFDLSSLTHQFQDFGDAAVVNAVFSQLQRDSKLRLTERGVGLADRGPKLSKGERELMSQLIEQFRGAGFQPPSLKECEQSASKNQKSVRSLLALAANDGDLVEVGSGMYLHADVEQELRRRMIRAFEDRPELTMSEIREILGTSRKYGVPLGEYMDRIGFTQRQGDVRRLSSTTGQATV